MEEYEVDLREYIDVLRREWAVVVVIFLAALISATVFSFSQPDEYQSEAVISLRQKSTVSQADAIEILNGMAALEKAPALFGNVEVEGVKKTGQIRVRLKGSQREAVRDGLKAYLGTALAELNKRAAEETLEEYSRAQNLSSVYGAEKARLEDELRERLSIVAEAELARVNRSIQLYEEEKRELQDMLAANPELDFLALELGSVNTKLAQLESRRDELEWIKRGGRPSLAEELIASDPELEFLNARLEALNQNLIQLEIKKMRLESETPAAAEILTPPTQPRLTGPKRLLNITIAGALGLLIGVFTAFFKSYMEGSS